MDHMVSGVGTSMVVITGGKLAGIMVEAQKKLRACRPQVKVWDKWVVMDALGKARLNTYGNNAADVALHVLGYKLIPVKPPGSKVQFAPRSSKLKNGRALVGRTLFVS